MGRHDSTMARVTFQQVVRNGKRFAFIFQLLRATGSCTMFKLLATVAILAVVTVSTSSNLVLAENGKPLNNSPPDQVQNPQSKQDNADPVSFFESLLPPRFRKLGANLNPLQCVGDTMVAGDKLVIGQAVCFDGYEFGLADNGKVTFFDHWNHHPEVVIWQEPATKGSYLYLDHNGGGLALYNEQDKVVWQIGTATASATSSTTENDAMNVLKVTENGTVELLSRNGSIHWAINVNGIATAM
jgi:hypothetical protein